MLAIACVASVFVRFRSKERRTRVKDRAKNSASERAGRRRRRRKPPPPAPSFIFWLLFHFSRGQNRETRSSVLLCSETKRKRLLRRLCSVSWRLIYWLFRITLSSTSSTFQIVINTNLLLTWIRCKGRCTNLVHLRGNTSLLLIHDIFSQMAKPCLY